MAETPTPAAAEPTFESGMTRLEAIVQELEQGALGLQQSLGVFREGMQLVARLGQELEQAETQVQELVEAADGTLKLRASASAHGATALGGPVHDVDEADDDE